MIGMKRLPLAVAAFLAAASPAISDEPLSDQQILRLFPGTFEAVVKGKYQIKVTVMSGGAIIGEIPGLQDHGRWTVRDGELCILLPNWTRGRIECSPVVADSGWFRGRNVSFRKL